MEEHAGPASMSERRVRRRPAQQASRSLMISFFWLRRAKRGSNKAGGAMILGPGKGKHAPTSHYT